MVQMSLAISIDIYSLLKLADCTVITARVNMSETKHQVDYFIA